MINVLGVENYSISKKSTGCRLEGGKKKLAWATQLKSLPVKS